MTLPIVPDDLVEELLKDSREDLTDPTLLAELDQRFGRFTPSVEVFQKTVSSVFWASLANEEGKAALTRIRFSNSQTSACSLTPVPVSPTVLRKLSPFCDVPSSVLTIDENGNVTGVTGTRSRDLAITARSPGHLVVTRSDVIGVLEAGKWIVVKRSSTAAPLVLQKMLGWGAFKERMMKAGFTIRLALRAQQAGRGAAFVLLDSDSREGIGSIKYPVRQFELLTDAMQRTVDATVDTPTEDSRDTTQAMTELSLGVLAAGAGIDGATLIDASEFRLLGFGAKIDPGDQPKFEVDLLEVPSSSITPVPLTELGGMRHQMAARLVFRNHDATVVTVSQDGPVSLLTWSIPEQRVLMVKHVDRLFAAK